MDYIETGKMLDAHGNFIGGFSPIERLVGRNCLLKGSSFTVFSDDIAVIGSEVEILKG